MPSLQRIAAPGVVEGVGLPPVFLVVACGTVPIHELPFVRIILLMTVCTLRTQPQEGPLQGSSRALEVQNPAVENERRLVAVSALGLGVAPSKGVSGGVMGKIFGNEMHWSETFS